MDECQNCRYFKRDESATAGGSQPKTGRCFLNPPMPQLPSAEYWGRHWGRPATEETDFCQHHKQTKRK